MSKASERIKAALATNRIVIREEVKVLLGQYERLKTECDDLMALCEGINHALWLDPDASHDTDEAPAEIDAWRKTIESQREITDKLPTWQPFAAAPKDYEAILAWREDAGVMAVHWSPPAGAYRCISDIDVEDNDWCWFTLGGEDLTGDLPTLWKQFPNSPEAAEALAARSDDRERSATAATTPPTSRRYDE